MESSQQMHKLQPLQNSGRHYSRRMPNPAPAPTPTKGTCGLDKVIDLNPPLSAAYLRLTGDMGTKDPIPGAP